MNQAKPKPASATISVDLAATAQALHATEAHAPGSHGARTLVREPDLRVVLLVLAPGAKIPDHHVKDTATIQVLDGSVRVGVEDRVIELFAGQLLPLERGLEHDVAARERTTLLLTLSQLPG
jgi:quercetin dioxygenase-like cupin family protein